MARQSIPVAPSRRLAALRSVVVLPAIVVAFAAPAAAQITKLDTDASFSRGAGLITFDSYDGGQTTFSSETVPAGTVTIAYAGNPARRRCDIDGRPILIQVKLTECATGAPGNMRTNAIDNYTSAISSAPLEVRFSVPLTRVAFNVRHNADAVKPTNATVEFYLGQTLVGTSTTPAVTSVQSPAPWQFAGFASASPFDRIVVTAPPGSGYLKLDNVKFDPAASRRK